MTFRILSLSFCFAPFVSAVVHAADVSPVTDAELKNPDPADWLMVSRTYDSQRHSPLDQVDRGNVGGLQQAWRLSLPSGTSETVPIVHDGVMVVIVPGGHVLALDATTGEQLWDYAHGADNLASRSKGLAIYKDMVYYTAPDSYVVAIDVNTGKQRWEAPVNSRGNTSAPLVVDGKVISGGACFSSRDNCYLVAHDADTGEELWRFYTTPAPGEPGDETWGNAPVEKRMASTWGLPGSYDPDTGLIYWGVANAMPDLRVDRHNGDPDGTGRAAPADLYSNSTIALDPDTGELSWYYQHLPGDDADLDHTHERTLVTTAVAPDPDSVKWINPAITPGEVRDVSVIVSEGGSVFMNDRHTGEFLWAMPFPADVDNMLLGDIDVATGRTRINWDLVAKDTSAQRIVCYWNTRSYWPTSYDPATNSLYTSWIESCRQLDGPNWWVVPRPGVDPDKLTGLAKIDLSTGEVLKFDVGRAPGNGALLTTAGGLLFHGDLSKRFKAFDDATGKELWAATLDGNIAVSTITYAVDGVQYVAVMTGDNLKVPELLTLTPELGPATGNNSIYVFALP